MHRIRRPLPIALLALAAAASGQELAAAPPGHATAIAAKTAQRTHAAQLRAAHDSGAFGAQSAEPKSAPSLPYLRLLPNTRLSVGTAYSTGVAALDWNLDGLSDLATEASSGSGNPGLILLRQQSGADFANSQVKGSFGEVLARGDVNGDGLADLVDLGSKAWTFVGQANGTLVKGVGTTIGDFGWWEALGDLNGDGRDDIAVVDLFGDPVVHIALAVDGNKFGTQTNVAVPQQPGGVGLADMNGDGKVDLVTLVEASAQDKVAVLPGVGDGSFGAAVLSKMPSTLFPLDLAIADLDLDGDLDVAALQLNFSVPSDEAVDAMLGKGDGSFTKKGSYACSILGNLMTHGDLNGDGYEDLAVANYDDYLTLAGGGMDVLLGVGGGAFAPAHTCDLGGSPEGDVTADLDGDGDLDVALSQELQFIESLENPDFFEIVDLGLALGRGDGSFPSGLDAPLGAPAVDVAAADLDGDGDADLLCTRKGSETGTSALAFALQDGGEFATPVSVPLATDARHVVAADLDGDGLADAVVESGLFGGSLATLHNTGSPGAPSFDAGVVLGPLGADALQLADLDGDGGPDLLALHGDAQRLDLAYQLSPSAAALESQATDVAGSSLALADLDGDGALDAIVGSVAANALQVLRNANGKLTPDSPQPFAWAPACVVAADFDADGRPDLACLASGGTQVRLLAGQSGGAFADAGSLSLGDPCVALAALDLDRDHAPDLVASQPDDKLLLVRRGHGDFTFEATQSVCAPLGSGTLRTADVDGDHFPDLLVPAYDEGLVQVLLSESEFWTNAGHVLPASYGTPHLAVSGEPFAGQAVSMTVSGVPAGMPGVLVIGTSAANVPFHGGTLVPSPLLGQLVFAGQPLEDTWSDAPAGYAVWCQAWFVQAGEFAASNAVVGVTQ